MCRGFRARSGATAFSEAFQDRQAKIHFLSKVARCALRIQAPQAAQ
jgi:hypothetical protein